MRDGTATAKSFQKLASDIPVDDLLRQLEARPDLWDEYTERTRAPNSPHRDAHDIWIRFRRRAELTEPKHFAEPHFSEFYPAWNALPALQPIVWGLVRLMCPVHLGAILITRIPPGKMIHPHHDRGAWNAETMNCKIWTVLETNSRCISRFKDGAIVMRAGSAWSIDNLDTHSVENYGKTPRTTLITTMRVER